jgi:hypothetical protein
MKAGRHELLKYTPHTEQMKISIYSYSGSFCGTPLCIRSE